MRPFSHEDAVISGARHRFRRLLWLQCLRMRSKYISSTSRRKYLTESGFSYIDFLYDVEILAVPRCFSPILRFFTVHAQFRLFRFKIYN